MNIKTLLLSGLLLLLTLTISLPVHAQTMRPAVKLAVGEIAHFTLEANESKDFAVQLGAGTIAWDLKRVDEKPSNIMAKIQLLKSNGVIIESSLLRTNEIGITTRTGAQFRQPKPLAARLRVINEDVPLEVWMRVVPAAKMGFTPFPSGNGDIKPLGIGSNEGKGGTLEPNGWAYHSASLPAGKYDVSLYMKRTDGRSSNIMGRLQQLDSNGFILPNGRLNLNEVGTEARKDMRLVLTKPTKVLFHVINEDAAKEYTVGIEKATD